MGLERVLPRRLLALVSSNQFDCLVASLVVSMWVERSAANLVGSRLVLGVGAPALEEAVTPPFFRRLFRLGPSSLSDVEDSESDWVAGGGVAGRLRMVVFLDDRFLNRDGPISGCGSGTTASMIPGDGSLEMVEVQLLKRLRIASYLRSLSVEEVGGPSC